MHIFSPCMLKNIFITGASGSGKTTVIKYLLNKFPTTYLNISYTSRKPRKNEIHGKDYYFLTEEEFEQKIKNGELLEYVKFKGNYYGTPKNCITGFDKTKIHRIFDIELEGIKFFHKHLQEIGHTDNLFICLRATEDIIRNRLNLRLGISTFELENRISSVVDINNFINEFNFDFIVDSNQEMTQMLSEIENILFNFLNK